jgi:hypothetical protein
MRKQIPGHGGKHPRNVPEEDGGPPKKKTGRPKGSGNKLRSEQILKREFASGEIMPLDVMLSEMRRHYYEGTDEGLKEASALAQAAAPYCHRR